MTTLFDVAARAGVSVSIVSRVLSDDPEVRVRPETRERILAASRELDYTPNHAGRALRLAKSGALALVVPDVTNPVFADMVRAVEDEAQHNGYSVLLARSEWFTENSGGLRRLIGEGRVDGFLFQRADETTDAGLMRLLGAGIPTILLNTRSPGSRGSVTFDGVAAAMMATRHLVELGHRRIAHLGGPEGSDTSDRRLQGFRLCMTEAGLPVPPDAVTRSGYRPESGAAGIRHLLAARERPTAVFVANVNAAIGAMTAAIQSGLRVPEDLSIVALHDLWFAEHTTPPLTTVKSPLEAVGRAGVRLLLERLSSRSVDDVTVTDPPPRLIVRASTAPPA